MRIFVLVFTAILALTHAALAHEVRPAIGDLTVTDGQMRLTITLNAEAIVAGVNLDGVEDTNATASAEEVDALRVLEPDVLASQFRDGIDAFAAALKMTADGVPVDLSEVEIVVDPVGNIDLPRDTRITLEGAVAPGADALEMVWPARFGTLILRQQGVDEPYTGYLAGGQATGPIHLGGGDLTTATGALLGYIPVGFDHIVPLGLDHILFVLGLFFLSTRLGPLLWQVSAFTLAHTVTLALGALGLVTLPGNIVEPLIAASIVFVAVENILTSGLSRWRPMVVFVFGLLHGLGFASVLGEFGLPEAQFIPALLGFNIGVEIGQLFVIAMAFLLVWTAQKVDEGDTDPKIGQVTYGFLALVFFVLGFVFDAPWFSAAMGASAPVFLWPLAGLSVCCGLAAVNVDKLDAYRRFVAIPASVGIATVGAYWFVERVFL
ncbi:HupE/UreJ family protein [Puniceibacterium sp. IMCC21224]|uniref:HupE/UreJ family protein n=1 Tax=Puniceibacterium sp. IMCC21224 TaxID=1618204 RepID=UPI00064DEE4C|nr:HupE/UreJ family protein [Puniceibacterium sp. IMCC21224]KMK67158.1 HupE / UreJ protein [Puniceibacterium sp. IMCC21224]